MHGQSRKRDYSHNEWEAMLLKKHGRQKRQRIRQDKTSKMFVSFSHSMHSGVWFRNPNTLYDDGPPIAACGCGSHFALITWPKRFPKNPKIFPSHSIPHHFLLLLLESTFFITFLLNFSTLKTPITFDQENPFFPLYVFFFIHD